MSDTREQQILMLQELDSCVRENSANIVRLGDSIMQLYEAMKKAEEYTRVLQGIVNSAMTAVCPRSAISTPDCMMTPRSSCEDVMPATTLVASSSSSVYSVGSPLECGPVIRRRGGSAISRSNTPQRCISPLRRDTTAVEDSSPCAVRSTRRLRSMSTSCTMRPLHSGY